MILPTFDSGQKAVVQMSDGSLWQCEVDSTGRLTLVKELKKPEPPKAPPMPMLPGSPMPGAYDPVERVFAPPNPISEMVEPSPGPETIYKPVSDNVFRERLSSIMTDNMYDRRVRGSKRGKLDMLRLWKAEAGATNIFQLKQARKNKLYNIVLLVDESGSMQEGDGRSTRKIDMAAEVAIFLARSFEGLNLNLAIVGFNSIISIHKNFNEKVKDYALLHKTIIANAVEKESHGWNNDYDALAKSYEMLRGRKGQNFVIMMSDGEPATYSGANESQSVIQKMIEEQDPRYYNLDKMGKVNTLWTDRTHKLTTTQKDTKKHLHTLVHTNEDTTTIGIGIQSNNWQVPNNIREDDLEHLKPVILEQIKRRIRRG